MRASFVSCFMLEVDPLCSSSSHLLCLFCCTAILPCRRCWPEEDVLGEESWSAVPAVRLVSVHPGYRQAHQEVCPLTKRSGYDFTLITHTYCICPQRVYYTNVSRLFSESAFVYLWSYRTKSMRQNWATSKLLWILFVFWSCSDFSVCPQSMEGKGSDTVQMKTPHQKKVHPSPHKRLSLDVKLVFSHLCSYTFTKQCPKTQSSSACLTSPSSFTTFSLITLVSLWVSVKTEVSVTGFVFAASGVDTVGEVVMNVDILPQPNGEHKIGIKGENTTCS